ncbi:oxidoreductase [Psychromonas sp. B3M02]|uniref:oxidoreductase n=1 Tax=Psychromonas sp. B3M02 TaxID=2267226 RepID=UPI000DE9B3EC|nr:tRNA-dihydrouridine synthase [Psychromonas sp. B3M02]RBW42623.1 oxidoreductase [Psychromonas sp. B3M02]
MPTTEEPINMLSQPLNLPCGVVLKNRIVKSAMSDSLADGQGNPTDAQARLYEKWAEGGVGLSIIGEVQVDPKFPERPSNLVLCEQSNLKKLQSLTSKAKVNGAHIWAQLGHAGGLSHPTISQPKGPSALKIDNFECAGMSEAEVAQLPNIYAKAAMLAKEVGFSGVQIHAGHGFLLSQFLSPLFNHRNDMYAGDILSRCKIIIDIIDKVRSVVGEKFPIGIKINCTDQLEGGLTQQDALSAMSILDKTTIDLIEISGGSYFPGAKSSSDSLTKGPYFIDFSKKAKQRTSIPIVVTGGFKTREEAITSLQSHAADMVGIARALALDPTLANNWLNHTGNNPMFPRFTSVPEGGITAWYTMRLNAIGNDNESDYSLELEAAIETYENRDAARCIQWLAKFQ